jgi:hypothetical protein
MVYSDARLGWSNSSPDYFQTTNVLQLSPILTHSDQLFDSRKTGSIPVGSRAAADIGYRRRAGQDQSAAHT